jgi:hypothetical protein
MTAPSGTMLPVGARYCAVFALNADGVIAASSTTPYEGVQVAGVKAFAPNWVSPRIIDHAGDDILLNRDILPPITGAAMTITTSEDDLNVTALLNSTKVATVGEAKRVGIMTSKQGFESQVGVFVWQQAVDASATGVAGARRWRGVIMPKAFAVPKPQGMAETTQDTTFDLTPQVVRAGIDGLAYTDATDGFVSTQAEDWMFTYHPRIVAWKSASGTPAKFLFNVLYPAQATTKIHRVTLYTAATGVVTDITSSATLAVDGITPTSIANNDIVTAIYEYA